MSNTLILSTEKLTDYGVSPEEAGVTPTSRIIGDYAVIPLDTTNRKRLKKLFEEFLESTEQKMIAIDGTWDNHALLYSGDPDHHHSAKTPAVTGATLRMDAVNTTGNSLIVSLAHQVWWRFSDPKSHEVYDTEALDIESFIQHL